MNQIQLINAVRVWERRLEIENEKRRNEQVQPYANAQAELQRLCEENKPLKKRIFKPKRERQPFSPCYNQESYIPKYTKTV